MCQRLGVEAVEGAGPIPGASPRCPGQTLSARAASLCGSSTGLAPTLTVCRDPCNILYNNFVATLKIKHLDTSHQYSQGPPHKGLSSAHSHMLLPLSGEGCRGSTRSLHQVSRGDTLCHTGTLLCYCHLNTGTLLASLNITQHKYR